MYTEPHNSAVRSISKLIMPTITPNVILSQTIFMKLILKFDKKPTPHAITAMTILIARMISIVIRTNMDLFLNKLKDFFNTFKAFFSLSKNIIGYRNKIASFTRINKTIVDSTAITLVAAMANKGIVNLKRRNTAPESAPMMTTATKLIRNTYILINTIGQKKPFFLMKI